MSPERLEKVLRDFNFTYDTLVAGILTKTGVPLAIQANVEVEKEHFATMAATLMGSTEVIYRGLGLSSPEQVLVRSRDGIMLVLNLDRNAFFVALGREGCVLEEKAEEASQALRRVLEPLRPLEKFAV